MRLVFTACSTTYVVISLDSEAGYHGTPAFSAYSTLPVSASISTAASVGDEACAAPARSMPRAMLVSAIAATNIGGRVDDTNFTGGSVLLSGLETSMGSPDISII